MNGALKILANAVARTSLLSSRVLKDNKAVKFYARIQCILELADLDNLSLCLPKNSGNTAFVGILSLVLGKRKFKNKLFNCSQLTDLRMKGSVILKYFLCIIIKIMIVKYLYYPFPLWALQG